MPLAAGARLGPSDRVVPAHSFKYPAALQAGQAGDNPVLIRIDTKSGHGASSITKAVDHPPTSNRFPPRLHANVPSSGDVTG